MFEAIGDLIDAYNIWLFGLPLFWRVVISLGLYIMFWLSIYGAVTFWRYDVRGRKR